MQIPAVAGFEKPNHIRFINCRLLAPVVRLSQKEAVCWI